MKRISLDTETTGSDFFHGARPYLVTTCDENLNQWFWEWEVDPLTRQVKMPEEDILEIRDLIKSADELVLQNAGFDYLALKVADPRIVEFWDWSKVRDTLIASHLLASGMPHDLTSLGIQFLGIDIEPLEEAIKKATKDARNRVRKSFPTWRIAKDGEEDMPSVKDQTWKVDMWLPKLLAMTWGQPDHEWTKLCAEYANGDSALTASLWPIMEAEIRQRGLEKIYAERLKLCLSIPHKMKARGVTYSDIRLEQLNTLFQEEINKASSECLSIAKSYDYDLVLPKGAGNNNSLREFVFDVLKMPHLKHSATTGDPSLDKTVIESWIDTLDVSKKKSNEGDGSLQIISADNENQLRFVKALVSKRKRETACSYMRGYSRFSKHVVDEYYRLHPNLNPTGTAHLRWSCSNPNEQNISKQPGFNLRYVFGPLPGREWWSIDAKNVELRIPAFECREEELIKVFEKPNEGPYYGSYHLAIFDVLHPELFKEYGVKCKDLFEATWYQWVKNGNFAVLYGCQERKADETYHVQGAFKKIRHRFPKMAKLSDHYIAYANKYGYVTTLPDKSVDPEKGYPIQCSRGDRGMVLPTVPLNYHVSGTAMWVTGRAMIRCDEQLTQWNEELGIGEDDYLNPLGYYMPLQVHDELMFDMPKREHPLKAKDKKKTNLWRAMKLKSLFEMGGADIGIPTPCGLKYHEENWSHGDTIA